RRAQQVRGHELRRDRRDHGTDDQGGQVALEPGAVRLATGAGELHFDGQYHRAADARRATARVNRWPNNRRSPTPTARNWSPTSTANSTPPLSSASRRG